MVDRDRTFKAGGCRLPIDSCLHKLRPEIFFSDLPVKMSAICLANVLPNIQCRSLDEIILTLCKYSSLFVVSKGLTNRQ